MLVEIQKAGLVVDNVGIPVMKYPENIQSIIYSYRLRFRLVSKFMQFLGNIVSDSIEKIDDPALKQKLKDWQNVITLLKDKPADRSFWMRYFTTYQGVLESSNNLLSGVIEGISQNIEEDKIRPDSGQYLIQSLKLVIDVFKYFHTLSGESKSGKISDTGKFQMFDSFMADYIDFSGNVKELITKTIENKEIPEEFINRLNDSSSELNLLLIKAYLLIGIFLQSDVLSEYSEVVLSGYTDEEQNNIT